MPSAGLTGKCSFAFHVVGRVLTASLCVLQVRLEWRRCTTSPPAVKVQSLSCLCLWTSPDCPLTLESFCVVLILRTLVVEIVGTEILRAYIPIRKMQSCTANPHLFMEWTWRLELDMGCVITYACLSKPGLVYQLACVHGSVSRRAVFEVLFFVLPTRIISVLVTKSKCKQDE